jgi:FAD:protein FMN transferase
MTILPTITGLGTSWWVEIFAELDNDKTQVIYDDLRFIINEFDDNYSRFKPESILNELNDAHFITHPTPEFLEIIALGQKLYKDTNEVFNPLIGEHIDATGYDNAYSFIPKEISSPIPDPLDVIKLSPEKALLIMGRLDIGGYGKGYLIDKIAKRLSAHHGLPYFVINGGGDMYATSNQGEPIEIYLQHPTDHNIAVATTTLLNQGFAASSTHKRRWKHGDLTYSHIIQTEDGSASLANHGVYVKAPKSALADAWATTLLLSLPEDHLAILERDHISVAIYHQADKTLSRYGGF